MPRKNKKNTISDKLNKLSLEIETIHKGLDNPRRSIEEFKVGLA
jgi:archaellum component FlaC